MADIFLSYASRDRDRVRPLVEAFEQQGWTVWWDRRIAPGQTWHQAIQESLDGARCVVVVWSQHSIKSDWVIVEAEEGKGRGTLIPVLIDDVKPPLSFRLIQAARLLDWQGAAAHPEWDFLLDTIKTVIGAPAPPQDTNQPRPRVDTPTEPVIERGAESPLTMAGAGEPAMAAEPLVEPDRKLPAPPVPINRLSPPREKRPSASLNEEPIPQPIATAAATQDRLVTTPPRRADEQITPRRSEPSALPRRWLLLGGTTVMLIAIVFISIWRRSSNDNGAKNEQPTPSAAPVATSASEEFNVVTLDASGKMVAPRPGKAQYFTEDLGDNVKLELVALPGGTFNMGSPNNEANRDADESPQHQVTVRPFWMGKYEVTQAQWRVAAGWPKLKTDLTPAPSNFKGDDLPVEKVSWDAAMEFCSRLSRKTGKKYRLPSEAEWEYAARAGTTTPFAFGETITPEIVNYDGNHPYAAAPKGRSRQMTVSVGSLGAANAFGLLDMHGNVWEWCLDVWRPNYQGAPTDGGAWLGDDGGRSRVMRGGSWNYYALGCRAASRGKHTPDYSKDYIGLRVVSQ